jgi:type I restriction enzyme S subunit
MIDLRPDHLEIVRDLLRQHVPECEVRAFGSRFKWTAKQASDLDLAVVGTKRLPTKKIMRLKEAFEESILPMRVDVLDWHAITPEFQRVIDAGFEVIQEGGEVSPLAPASSPSAAGSSATPLLKSASIYGSSIESNTSVYPTFKVSELAAPVKNAIVGGPFGSDLVSKDYVPSGIPVIRGQNMGCGRWVGGDFVFVSKEKAESLSANTASPGDLLFTQRGTLGQVAIVPPSPYQKYLISQSQMKLTVNEEIVDSLFMYYLFTSEEQQSYIQANAIQAGVPHTNLGILKNTPVQIPPLPIQKAIAQVLGKLDDRIELCRRTNETLESTARALFKDWFIDFGPVRAKLEGRDPYLSADVWSLFPDRLVDSDLGEIPDSWTCATLKDLTVKIGSGSTPRGGSEVYIDSGISLIRSQNVYDSNFVWDGLAYITYSAAEQLKNVTLELEDVLINITGASILRTCVVEPATLPARVNQHVAIIRAKPEIPSRYLHLHLLQKSTKDFLMGMNAGASREAVTKAHLESTPIIRPSDKVLAEFKNSTAPLFNQIQQSNDSIRMLSSLRDNLLPKLLSGELSIPEAMLEAQVSG